MIGPMKYILIFCLLFSFGCSSIRIPDFPRPPKEEDPAPPAIDPVNDPAQPPADWRVLQGAPRELAPGVAWKAIWKANDAPPPAGVWRFEYRTGSGMLCKPESSLLLVPRKNPHNGYRLDANHIGASGEYADRLGTQLIKYFVWPGKTAMANQPIDGTTTPSDPENENYYHDGIKLRGARATRAGTHYIVRDVYGQELFHMQIIDREVVQR